MVRPMMASGGLERPPLLAAAVAVARDLALEVPEVQGAAAKGQIPAQIMALLGQ